METEQLAGRGWAPAAPYYRGTGERRTHCDHVDWGGADSRLMNEWVTAHALAVLNTAGRC